MPDNWWDYLPWGPEGIYSQTETKLGPLTVTQPTGDGFEYFPSGPTTPGATTSGGISVPPYDQLIGMSGITDLAKASIIKQYYPGRFSDWLFSDGANYFSQGQIVAPGLILLPGGTYFAEAEGRVVPPDYAQSLINQAMGTAPSNLPAGAVQVSPNFYRLPDGTFVNTNGEPASQELVVADMSGAGIGGSGDVAYRTELQDPQTGEIFEVAYDRSGNELSRVSTGRFGQIGGPGGITAYQQSQIDLQQQQYELDQQQFAFQQQQAAAQLAQQQANYLADLRANPASWIEYSLASGQSPTIQPWMWGLLPEELRAGTGVGQPITGQPAAPQLTGGEQYLSAPTAGGTLSPAASLGVEGPLGTLASLPQQGAPITAAQQAGIQQGQDLYGLGTSTYVQPNETSYANYVDLARQSKVIQDEINQMTQVYVGGAYNSMELPQQQAFDARLKELNNQLNALTPQIQSAYQSAYAAPPAAPYSGTPAEPLQLQPGAGFAQPGGPGGEVLTTPTRTPTAATGTNIFNQGGYPQGSGFNLPQLTTPGPQYYARMGPTAQQQYLGYEQARTGSPLEQTQWQLWSQAPPGGGSFNLSQWR